MFDSQRVCASFHQQAFHSLQTLRANARHARPPLPSVQENCKQEQAFVNFLQYLNANIAEHMPNSEGMPLLFNLKIEVYEIFFRFSCDVPSRPRTTANGLLPGFLETSVPAY